MIIPRDTGSPAVSRHGRFVFPSYALEEPHADLHHDAHGPGVGAETTRHKMSENDYDADGVRGTAFAEMSEELPPDPTEPEDLLKNEEQPT